MKSLILVFVQILFVHLCCAQKLQPRFLQDLPDSVTFHETVWADADNDGLLDVIAFAESTSDETICYLFRNDSFQGLVFAGHQQTRTSNAGWLITDVDGDNLIDILVSGAVQGRPVTSQFLNQGDFTFEKTQVLDAAGKVIRMADLNADGSREIILSGESDGSPFLRLYQLSGDVWKSVHDSIAVAAESIEVFDMDGDGRNDILLSGTDDSAAKVTRAYLHAGGFYFIPMNVSPAVAGRSAVADLNHDGNLDVLLSGKDNAGQNRLVALFNSGPGGFVSADTLRAVDDAVIFAGDLDSDGQCNINVFGVVQAGDTVNFTAGTPEIVIPHRAVVSQSWGDGERDGDLDLLQLRKTETGYHLYVLENTTTSINQAPQAPTLPVIAQIFNRLFISWVKPVDDRTPVQSVTYDVFIQTTGRSLMPADFDVLTGRRLNVSQGNNGTANYLLVKANNSDVFAGIQAVDNAFHAGPGSICEGSGAGSGLCREMATSNLGLCKNERVALRESPGTQWFSFKHGFLADTTELVFDFHEPDTIFSLARQPHCAMISVYVLEAAENVSKVTESAAYVCENEVLRLGVEPDWTNVEWSSVTSGILSAEDSIIYPVTAPDTIKVRVSDDNGCVIQRNIAANISKPVIKTPHDAYQILKGESVRLTVTGGTSYQWSPVAGLDDPASSNPIASPRTTTEYSVTAKDSLGCVASLPILVMVEETAFIPNLFTPNSDGKNDELKIYGLREANGFSFTIYNREGSEVYNSQNISEVVNQGWNGRTGGTDQPSGVYYWSVAGETTTGKELQLNGKRSGSIVLLR